MPRRKWDTRTKALIVLQGLKGTPVSALCTGHQISQAQLDFLGEGFDAATAEREFRKAIELRPNFTLAHEHLARLLRTQGRVQNAIAEFDTLIEISPSTADYTYERAKLLEKVGRSSDALISYR